MNLYWVPGLTKINPDPDCTELPYSKLETLVIDNIDTNYTADHQDICEALQKNANSLRKLSVSMTRIVDPASIRYTRPGKGNRYFPFGIRRLEGSPDKYSPVLKNLRVLHLAYFDHHAQLNYGFSDAIICKNLTRLKLVHCRGVEDVLIKELEQFSSLILLHSSYSLSAEAMSIVLDGLPSSLQHIHFKTSKDDGYPSMEGLKKHAGSLKSLWLEAVSREKWSPVSLWGHADSDEEATLWMILVKCQYLEEVAFAADEDILETQDLEACWEPLSNLKCLRILGGFEGIALLEVPLWIGRYQYVYPGAGERSRSITERRWFVLGVRTTEGTKFFVVEPQFTIRGDIQPLIYGTNLLEARKLIPDSMVLDAEMEDIPFWER
ncbi:hypothetical protein ABW19_dt0209741 [Dactylella cylindrospora]|nr:hypothetical protein ABW19_dt0209741 [Dactylella cylindrospora]